MIACVGIKKEQTLTLDGTCLLSNGEIPKFSIADFLNNVKY